MNRPPHRADRHTRWHRHRCHPRRGHGRRQGAAGRGQEITAAITLEAVEELGIAVTDLGLSAGSAVTALIKSTEISLATA